MNFGDMSAAWTHPMCHWTATTDPGVTDDSSKGYQPGSWWLNLSAQKLWFLLDATTARASWRVVKL